MTEVKKVIAELREDAAEVGKLPWRSDAVAVRDAAGRHIVYPESADVGSALASLSEVLARAESTPQQIDQALQAAPRPQGNGKEGPAGLVVDNVGTVCKPDLWPVLKRVLEGGPRLRAAAEVDELRELIPPDLPNAPVKQLGGKLL